MRLPSPSFCTVPPSFFRLWDAPLAEVEAKATASPKDALLGRFFCKRVVWIMASFRSWDTFLLPLGLGSLADFSKTPC